MLWIFTASDTVNILQNLFIRCNMAIGLGLHCKLRYITPILRFHINVFYSIHLLAVIWHLIAISIIIIIIIIVVVVYVVLLLIIS